MTQADHLMQTCLMIWSDKFTVSLINKPPILPSISLIHDTLEPQSLVIHSSEGVDLTFPVALAMALQVQ